MRLFNNALTILLLSLLAVPVYGRADNTDTLKYEMLMSPLLLKQQGLDRDFSNSFDITPNNLLLLSSADQLWLLGWDGMVPFGKPVGSTVDGFVFAPDSALLVVSGNRLFTLGGEGNLIPLFTLPSWNMGITRGRELVYLYDRSMTSGSSSVYAVAPGARIARLFDIPATITSLAEMNGTLLFSADNCLFRYGLADRSLEALAVLPVSMKILSVAPESLSGRIFFSTQDRIYGLKDTTATLISGDFGGYLSARPNSLFVYNPGKKILLRIPGIDKAVEAHAAAGEVQEIRMQGMVLTNSDVIRMVKAELPAEIIRELIGHSEPGFDLDPEAVIRLADAGVPSAVIMAMRESQKKVIDKKK